MAESTSIEKKSLEAHVELCAERYNNLEHRLDKLDDDHKTSMGLLRELHDMIQKMTEKNTDRLINWGVGIIGALVATTIYLITHYVIT